MPNLLDLNFISRYVKTLPEALLLPTYNKDIVDQSLEDYIYTVKYHFKKHNKKYIVFNDFLESPRCTYFNFLNTTGKELLQSLSIDTSRCKYFCGATNISDNTVKYVNLINQHNLLRLPIYYSDYFEKNFANTLNSNDKPLFTDPVLPKDKRFLFLAGSPRLHRVWLLLHLIKQGILSNCLYSMFVDEFYFIERLQLWEHILFVYEDVEVIKNAKLVLPQYLTSNIGDWSRQHQLPKDDVTLFNQAYISIIAETVFFQNRYDLPSPYLDNNEYHYDFTFLTEKTFRAIALKHPFIILSLPNSLKTLHKLGYKTFSPYIDESYDEITDDMARLQRILDLIATINSYTDKQMLDFYNNILPIVEYNYSVLRDRNISYTI